MALWGGLGQAATVAQLVGADVGGLVSSILQAVRTARRNRRECRLLARRVMMVSDLLQLLHLQSTETTRQPAIARALDGLGGALRQAYELVESCQEGSAVYGFIMSGRQAEQFRDVQDEIDSYLLVFPVVSHIDITRRLDNIYNILLPQQQDENQVSQEVMSSTTRHLEPYMRNQQNTLDLIQRESNQTTVEIFGVGNDERTGPRVLQMALENFLSNNEQGLQEGLAELLSRDQRSRWLCWWPEVDTRDNLVFQFLKSSTNNFSSKNEIGRGGSATIYKGQICDGLLIAIKRYQEDAHQIVDGHEIAVTRYNEDIHGQLLDYETECHVVKNLQHSNIVKLLGNSTGGGNMILVYEYMPNGSLDKSIFGKGTTLDWFSRFRIIRGIVQGLIYLHTHTPQIVHRDVKPSNILLDSDMNAKISDFGIAMMLSTEQGDSASLAGTCGHVDPYYLRTGTLSTKVDVYAFGITLLEIIAARRCYDSLWNEWLLPHAWDLWTTGRSIELLDPPLPVEHQSAELMVRRCVQIALLCVHCDPADRPTMSDVFVMLTSENINLPDPVQGAPCGWREHMYYQKLEAPRRGRLMYANMNLPEPVQGTPCGWREHKNDDVMYESDATWSSSDFTLPR